MKTARSSQEEITLSQGACDSETITGTSDCCRGETTIRAESCARLPAWKAKLLQSAFVGNFKEQDEGDAQEVAAVCRDSLPW